MKDLQETIYSLIQETSTKIPADVLKILSKFSNAEEKGTPSAMAMDLIEKNIDLASNETAAVCQDTGSIIFFVRHPRNFDQSAFIKSAEKAVIRATEAGLLRQNSIDPLTGVNSENNLGPGTPFFYFNQHESEELEIRLMLKGGGCENVGRQYSLPDEEHDIGRDINGVRQCILETIQKAQGKGCSPGTIGVCIGGDRMTGYIHSKEQLLRPLDDENPDSTLAVLENEIVEEANELGIGPMGFGGKTTLLACKIGVLNRLPASYFVTISYMCWAFRRQGIIVDKDGKLKTWIY